MKRRIGILTSGGDCPGLNATIRGVAKACYEMLGTENVEIVGISDGYYGLIHNICKEMSPDDFSGILTRGGTILGTAASVVLAAANGRVAARFCGMWFQPPAALPPVVPAIKSTFYIINPTPATLLYMR